MHQELTDVATETMLADSRRAVQELSQPCFWFFLNNCHLNSSGEKKTV